MRMRWRSRYRLTAYGVALWVVLAIGIAGIAYTKNRDPGRWFILGLLFCPPIVFLVGFLPALPKIETKPPQTLPPMPPPRVD